MGQKVHPVSLRTGILYAWDSVWWSKKNLGTWVVEDEKIRDYIQKKYRKASLSKIKIERVANVLKITIFTGRSALLIGQKGAEVEALKKELEKFVSQKDYKIDLRIEEVKNMYFSAQMLANHIALQVERNMPYKRVMKKVMADAQREGIQGIKIKISGRLGGVEMARSEWYSEGRVPTQTLRADLDFAMDTAHTKYGCIGVKVWLFKGEIVDTRKVFAEELRSSVVPNHGNHSSHKGKNIKSSKESKANVLESKVEKE